MRNAPLLLFIAAVAVFSSAAMADGPSSESVPSADFYISPDGNDSNPGRIQQPVATFGKARDLVRQKIAAGLDHNILVLARGGTYGQADPLAFGPQDSGAEKYSITYAAYPGEKVILSGGRKITGWTKGNGEVWTAQIPEVKAGDWYFRQLFVNGNRVIRARTPVGTLSQPAWWHIKTSTAQREPPPRDSTITLSVDHPIPAWKNPSDVEIVFMDNNETSRRRLGTVDATAQTFTIPPPQESVSKIFTYDWTLSIPLPGEDCFLENAREFLTAPGEWYLDRRTGVLSYWPQPGEDMTQAEVIAPVAQNTLLSVAGTAAAPVRNLHFDGIAVEYVDWPLPPAGFYGLFGSLLVTDSDKPIHRWMEGAVSFENARSCSFSNGAIGHVGGAGLCLFKGTGDIVVDRNEIFDTGGSGINAGGLRNRSTLKWNPPPAEDDFKGYRFTNNEIHDCGLAYYGSVGILLALAQDAVIAHNLIHDTAYTGIAVCGNEDRQIPFAKNLTVEYNHVHHVMKVTQDGAGIYLTFPQAGRGALIRGNLFHDLGRGHGVYLDGPTGLGVKNYHFEDNVMYGADVVFSECKKEDNTWTNNIFMNKGTPPQSVIDAMLAKVGPQPAAVEATIDK